MDAKVTVSLIAAVAQNGVIGNQGGLPWNLRSDLLRFQRITKGHTVIAGSRTMDSILRHLRKPLPDRRTVILTAAQHYTAPPGVLVAHTMQDAVKLAAQEEVRINPERPEVFVIGGAAVYQLALPIATRFYLTNVAADVVGDTIFPDWNRKEWRLVTREFQDLKPGDDYPTTYEVWERNLP